MTSGTLVYKVDDRSILLPYYRRYLVDPLLPLIPARVNPNTITHLGHLLNLTGTVLLIALWPDRGPAFLVAMVLLQLYMWCDNADGSHARRTNQCSAFGEFLDHGLDQLNTVYIGYLSAMSLNVPPIWWVIITLIIPGAGAVTYWEQSRTGVFRLGLLNQVESLTVLSLCLVARGVLGGAFWTSFALFGLTLRTAVLLWMATTIVFGMMRSMWRVGAARGAGAVLPVVGLIGFGGAIVLAAALGALPTIAAVTMCTGANVYFGMRMLAHRLHGESPRIEAVLVVGTLIVAGLVLARLAGVGVSPFVAPGLAVLAAFVFGLYAIGDTRRSMIRLETTQAR